MPIDAAERLVDWTDAPQLANVAVTYLDAGLPKRALPAIARVAEFLGATTGDTDTETLLSMPREIHAAVPWLCPILARVFENEPVLRALALCPETDDPDEFPSRDVPTTSEWLTTAQLRAELDE